MNKKLLAACLVIAAFAVVPSLASANPILTAPTGTLLPPGTEIVQTGIGNSTLVTSTGTLTCTSDVLEGTVTSNSTASGVKGEITSAKFGGTGPTQSGAPGPECTGSNFFTPNTTITPAQSLPWCFEAPANADTFTVKGGKCGAQTAIKFKLDVTGIGTCEYTRAATVNGTFVTDGAGTNENTGSITSVPWTLSAGPGLCPSEGSLTTRFGVETKTSTEVYVSS